MAIYWKTSERQSEKETLHSIRIVFDAMLWVKSTGSQLTNIRFLLSGKLSGKWFITISTSGKIYKIVAELLTE